MATSPFATSLVSLRAAQVSKVTSLTAVGKIAR